MKMFHKMAFLTTFSIFSENVSINTNETLCYLATIMLFNVELLAFL